MITILITDTNAGIPVEADVYRKDYDINAIVDITTDVKKEDQFKLGYDYFESRSELILGDGAQISISDQVVVNDSLRVPKTDLSTGQTVYVKPRQFKSLYKVAPRVTGMDSKINKFYSGFIYYPANPMEKEILNTAISFVNKRNVKFLSATGFTVSYASGIVTVTVTRSGGHGLLTGRPISVTGLSIPEFNIKTTLTVLNSSQFKYTFAAVTNPGTPTGSLVYSSEIFGYYSSDAKILFHQINNGTANEFFVEIWIKNQSDQGGSNHSFLQNFYSDDWKIFVTRNDGITTHGNPYFDLAYSFDGMKLNSTLPIEVSQVDYILISSGVITNYTGFPD